MSINQNSNSQITLSRECSQLKTPNNLTFTVNIYFIKWGRHEYYVFTVWLYMLSDWKTGMYITIMNVLSSRCSIFYSYLLLSMLLSLDPCCHNSSIVISDSGTRRWPVSIPIVGGGVTPLYVNWIHFFVTQGHIDCVRSYIVFSWFPIDDTLGLYNPYPVKSNGQNAISELIQTDFRNVDNLYMASAKFAVKDGKLVN